jgi:translation initiation factor IF-2
VVHSGVGDVKPRDVRHAAIEEDVKCPILCFNVNADRKVMVEAKQEGVEVKIFTVVFDLFDEIKRRITAAGKRPPKEKLSK